MLYAELCANGSDRSKSAAAGSTLNASTRGRSILAVARSLYLSMLVLSCEMTRGYLRNCEMEEVLTDALVG